MNSKMNLIDINLCVLDLVARLLSNHRQTGVLQAVWFQVTLKLVNLSELPASVSELRGPRTAIPQLSVLWGSRARQEEEHWMPPEACCGKQTNFCQVCQRQACCCVVYLGSVSSSEGRGCLGLHVTLAS